MPFGAGLGAGSGFSAVAANAPAGGVVMSSPAGFVKLACCRLEEREWMKVAAAVATTAKPSHSQRRCSGELLGIAFLGLLLNLHARNPNHWAGGKHISRKLSKKLAKLPASGGSLRQRMPSAAKPKETQFAAGDAREFNIGIP